jgi:hypothetical protein
MSQRIWMLTCTALSISAAAAAQPAAPPVGTPPGPAPAATSAPPAEPAVQPAPSRPAEQPPVAPGSIEQTEPAPPSAPAAPGLFPTPAAEPEPETPAEEPPPPKELAVGTEGLFKPGLLLQAWFFVDHAGDDDPATEDTSLMFRMRRAEISAKGEIIPKLVAYAVMIDPAKVLEEQETTIVLEDGEEITVKQPPGAISVFQDLFITFQSEYLDASIGQFKIPVSWEGYNSSSKLLFAERAAVSREFGDKRDIGVRLAKTFEYFGYSAGLFNGSLLNNPDFNNAKDVALRLEGYPVSGLVVAGVVYTSIGDRGEPGTKDRFEGDLRYESGPFLFQGEFIRAHDVTSSGESEGQGFYGALAFTFAEVLQPALRIGYLDTNVDADVAAGSKDERVQVDVGLNYYLLKQEAKLQLNYSRFEYDDETPNNEVIFAAQVGF